MSLYEKIKLCVHIWWEEWPFLFQLVSGIIIISILAPPFIKMFFWWADLWVSI
jgi:hypothetical protein